jgi:hypothetical protein
MTSPGLTEFSVAGSMVITSPSSIAGRMLLPLILISTGILLESI